MATKKRKKPKKRAVAKQKQRAPYDIDDLADALGYDADDLAEELGYDTDDPEEFWESLDREDLEDMADYLDIDISELYDMKHGYDPGSR